MPQASKFRKNDFEVGFTLQGKGDRELIYVARKKFNSSDQKSMRNVSDSNRSSQQNQSYGNVSVVVTIREITKKRLVQSQTKQYQNAAQFLAQVRHENLLQVWGLFWDDKKVYYIMEPAIKTA